MSTPIFDFWAAMWRPWIVASLAPDELWQSINSGWSFGNITINEQNSSAPHTEQTILQQESYGRQIGTLLDAVYELAQADSSNPAYDKLKRLKKKVDRLKRQAASRRVAQLRRDLVLLRIVKHPAYESNLKALKLLLGPPTK